MTDFNANWRFLKGDPGNAMMPALDDSGWRAVNVPHDWSIEGPFSRELGSGNGFAPGGIAWYRKRFTLAPADRGSRVVVEFDGVYANSQVYVNGFVVGGRPNGYIGFECDLTPYLQFAGGGAGGAATGQTTGPAGDIGDNVIAVRVDHSRYADSRWYTGSGIYRNVRLRVTNPLHVAPHGLYVTTPQVNETAAIVKVVATLRNSSGREPRFTVQHDILDPDGRTVGSAALSGSIRGDGEVLLSQDVRIERPRRWSLESPALYTLRTRVSDAGGPVDETTTTFGIRTIRFDADKGFFLNGVPTKIKGVCIHHDAGALGAAVPEKVLERRLRLLKELGANAIRTSHNPPAPELLDLCDRLGLLVQDEAFDEFTPAKNKWIAGWNAGVPSRWGYADDFAQWAERDLADMVRRDRNHPSIIMWSIGNEIDYGNDPFSHPALGAERYRPHHPPASELVRLGKPLVDVVKRLDPTRPVTAALATVAMSDAVGFADILDVAGYNYQEARYAEDHAKHPRRVLYGSENNHRYDNWLAVRDNEYIAGQFLWTGIDYLGEARAWPTRGSNAGLLDTCGFRKPMAWYRQSLWRAEPMVYLCTLSSGNAGGAGGAGAASGPSAQPATRPTATTPTTGGGGGGRGIASRSEESWNRPAGSTATVVCFTNCPEVALTLNGRTIGTKRASEAVEGALTWTVPFEPGVLKAVGLKDGKPVTEFELRTAGPAARIELAPDVKSLRADGRDVCHVEFRVTDATGVRVPNARDRLRFKLTGPATLLGIDNGEMSGDVNYRASEQAAFRGRGLAIVQSTADAGAVVLEVSGDGLEPARLELPSR